MEEDKNAVLKLLKLDLGISSTVKDVYFGSLIEACKSELQKKFELDLSKLEDTMLLTDFCAWRYRNRISGQAIPQNITDRIRKRSIRRRIDGTIT